ncbi:putative Mannosyltransferase [Bradyrhizobium sp. ORS 375]|uniref:glycosyltransferase n=1 Tax=Bradyrhizobium sp. (strain ORS 375) TaxID=566679 RepID=UPI000240964F|nr:glycosyltransferase [Bradyrhizobium sp. ORS 375]CCD92765.1 putative Mannosyltransferase [Bradyrhizobium sp. ORS 375]
MPHPNRILLIGNYAADRQHSMLRYADWLAGALRAEGWHVDLIAPEPRLALKTLRSRALRKWLGFIDKFVLFPLKLRRLAAGYDLVHICDHSNAAYIFALSGHRVSLTCHDLIPIKVLAGEVPGQTLGGTNAWLQRLIRLSLRRLRNLAFVSEATRTDFVRLIGPVQGAQQVIFNPVIGFGTMTPARARDLIAAAGIPPSRAFLLHVGSDLWYKNRQGALRLFELLHRTAIAGLSDPLMVSVGPSLQDPVPVARESLIVISEADDALIEALYTEAEALLFPSLDEGFGWPIIEAQACGCPVVTSDREPMRSIAGPAALLIDPVQLDEAAQLIAARWGWLTAQRQAARDHAQDFSPAAAAATYSAFMTDVAGRGDPAESRR